jgi:hypothetical protein
LHLRIAQEQTGDHIQALANRFYLGFPGQFDLVAESLNFLKSFEVFRSHDAILH